MYRFIFENANLGTVTLNTIPVNIAEIDSYFIRSEKYHGINQQIEDVSFVWIDDAAEYIRKAVNYFGAQSEVKVTIQYTDNNIDFDSFYSGVLDLKTFADDLDTVNCRVVSSSAEVKFLNNIDTDYKVALPSEIKIRQRNKEFPAAWDCLTTENLTAKRTVTSINTLSINTKKYTAIDCVLNAGGDLEHFSSNVIRTDSEIDFNDNPNMPEIAINSIYKCQNENGAITITVPSIRLNVYRFEDLGGIPATQARLRIVALRFNSVGEYITNYVLRQTGLFNQGGSTGATTPYASVLTSNIITTVAGAAKDDKIVIAIDCIHSGNPNVAIDYKFDDEFAISMNAVEYKTDTSHRAITISNLFNNLIGWTQTNEAPTVLPDLLDSEIFSSPSHYRLNFATSGTELRRFAGGNGQMITSFDKLWSALNVPYCLGMGIRKAGTSLKVQIDHRSKFYETRIIHDLGEVADLKIEFDETIIYNALNIEYPGVDNKDFANGIYEYLTKYAYTLPTNYTDNKLENVCGYKVDATTIEEQRTNQVTETQDNQTDDTTNFLIKCVLSGSDYVNSRGEEYSSVSQTGLQNTTQLFNLDYFAPVTLRFWAWWLLAGFKFLAATSLIKNQKAEQNGSVAITIDGVLYDTNDITIAKLRQIAAEQPYSDADGDLFEPFTYTFSAPVTAQFIKKFSADRHGVIKFTFRNETYYGFAAKIPALPNKAGEFKLIKLSRRGQSLCV